MACILSNLSAMLRDLSQLASAVLQLLGGLLRLQKNILSWQGSKCFYMFSPYSTFPVLRFEGIPVFHPFVQMILKIPDPECYGISACLTSCLASFNDSIYAFNRCIYPLLSQSCSGSSHDVTAFLKVFHSHCFPGYCFSIFLTFISKTFNCLQQATSVWHCTVSKHLGLHPWLLEKSQSIIQKANAFHWSVLKYILL